MTDIAIRVEHLSKLYHIGSKQERYKTLRDNIQTFKRYLGPESRLLRGQARRRGGHPFGHPTCRSHEVAPHRPAQGRLWPERGG